MVGISGLMKDGLGFEEVNQSPASTIDVNSENISGTNIYGVSGTVTRANVTTLIGTTVSGATVRSTLGIVHTSNIGSAYGAIIQTGSIATSAGSVGTIEFGRDFSDNHYTIVVGAYDAAGSGVYCYAGSKHLSGCEIVGEASVVYDSIAIGL